MSDLIGLLITFLPLFMILLLANASQRARERDAALLADYNAALPAGPAPDAQPFAAEPYAPTAPLLDPAAWSPAPLGPPRPPDNAAAIFRVLAYLVLAVIYLLLMLIALGMLAASGQPGLPIGGLAIASPAALGWMLAASLLGLLLLWQPVRRLCARFVPIDPANPVHAVALSMSMLVIISMLLTLGVGLGNLSDMVSAAQEAGASATTFASIWGQQIIMLLLAFVGVGWPLRRGVPAAMRRLGLVRPTLRQVLIGLGLAFVMVAVVIVIQILTGLLGYGGDADVDKLTEQLLGPLFTSPLGILTLGLAAALGEEPLMRGATQPRLGLLLTAALFALLHSNYGITLSTAVVFLLGLLLGWIRLRHNTTTSMVTHATYNMLIGLMGYLSIDVLQQFNK